MKFKIWAAWSLCLKKKKKFLKPKQICIMYTEKPQKEKKKWKEMKWTKVPVQWTISSFEILIKLLIIVI